MSFITKEDYASHIDENILDDITEVDDEKIEACQKRAIGFVKDHLNARYDVNAIFAQTGENRNPTVLGHTIDITIYYLHRLVNWRKTPSERVKAYNEAKDWLTGIKKLEINPADLPLVQDGSKDYILSGGNPRRDHHI